MDKKSKIYIAGHRGLLGSALCRILREEGYGSLCVRESADLDLRDPAAVNAFFKKNDIEYVFLCAARVGGISANMLYPAQFIYDNLMIQTNVIHAAHAFGVKKLLFPASACTYPRKCPQPIKEEYLLTSALEPTNQAYALAKLAGIGMVQAYKAQYRGNFICAVPANMYGINDTFDPQYSHVIPALMARFHKAMLEKKEDVVIWGTGDPQREFIYADDAARSCVFLMNTYESAEIINVGTGLAVSIRDLVYMIRDTVGFEGRIVFDSSRPDGMPKKVLDVSRLNDLGFRASTPLAEGLEKMYRWYKEHYD